MATDKQRAYSRKYYQEHKDKWRDSALRRKTGEKLVLKSGYKYGETHLCKCGCGQPAKRLVKNAGGLGGWAGYARGHAPDEPKEMFIPIGESRVLAYAAGIIDGEGCIYGNIRLRKTGCVETHVMIQVTMCSGSVIKWLKDNFGGRTYTDIPRSGHAAYKRRYTWQITSKQVAPLLRALLPYLIEKQERAKLAIQLSDSIADVWHRGRKGKLPAEEVARRTELAAGIKRYNRTTSGEDQPIDYVN